MITAVLSVAALEAGLVFLSSHPRTSRWFSILPAIFWMYFLPAVFARFGILNIPDELSRFSSQWLMPLALILIISPTDIGRLIRMGRESFQALAAVYGSMIIAAVISFFAFRAFFNADVWKAFAALGATWTGGTVNMLAVKEIVGLTESQFSVMVLTDAFLSYGWMVLLMLAFRWHQQFNRWSGGKTEPGILCESPRAGQWLHPLDAVWAGAAVLLALLAHEIGVRMPAGEAFPAKAWILLTASVLALCAAGFRWHRLTASRLSENGGMWLLYFVLMTMRAQADFLPHAKDYWIVAAGAVWLLVHGILMTGYARIFKVRMGVLAVASQAAVGGVVSAPIIAALYDRSLVSAAVLMGVFGNLVGTYLGLLIGALVRAVS